ncbi:MAG TPA: YqgE/AlgH family protein, partial [Rhodospirillales bacterium]|nr:YqgE/AlgH family protein [Rhodospirillales bacterium]
MALLPVAPERPAGAAARSPFLVGQMLVAGPGMVDPRFARTVVYLVAHNGDGAMGLVLNRSLGEGPLKALLLGFGVEDANVAGAVRLQYGGP